VDVRVPADLPDVGEVLDAFILDIVPDNIPEKGHAMNTEAHAMEAHAGASVGTNLAIWIGLVAITGLEVFLAYMELQPAIMLTILIGLSLVKAAMIMSYFMHLKFERFSLVLWLVPAMIFCICMMMIFFFPEAFRLLQMRPHG
jgi:cytochrome c oxidase subunit IV